MNVNDSFHNLQQVLGVQETNPVSDLQRSQQPTSDVAADAGRDKTEVSTAASLANQTMAVPDARMDKVVAVQQALANSNYTVSAADVADKLINHMLGK